MVEQKRIQVTRRLSWRIVGLTAILLGVGASVVGLIVGLVQANEVSDRLIEQTRDQAHQIAMITDELIEARLAPSLETLQSVDAGEMTPAMETLPDFVDGVVALRGEDVHVLRPSASAPDEWQAVAVKHLQEQAVMSFVPHTLLHNISFAALSDHWAIASLVRDSTGGRTGIAVALNVEAMVTELVHPLLRVVPNLHLTPTTTDGDLWASPLPPPLRHFSISPVEQFVLEQRNLFIHQTLVFVGLTLLVLSGLLSAMWLMIRTARREVALAAMKSSFVADVSHELKTPLALIHMFGETLQSGRVPTEERRQEYYNIITRESTRLTNLINNILDFSRIDAGRKEYILTATDVAEVVRETHASYASELDRLGFEHHLSIATDLPQVPADRDAVTQVLVNLISNAIKYAGEEKWLQIDVSRDTRRDRHGVLISVHDRGIGIKPDDRLRLFEGFFRAPDSRVREQRGAGLGLALVKHIVDAHHGAIDVEARLVKGTTFRVFLPAAESASAQAGSATRVQEPS